MIHSMPTEQVAFIDEGSTSIRVCAIVVVPHVAVFGLQPYVRRMCGSAPTEISCMLSIVLPTCLACACSEQVLVLLYAALCTFAAAELRRTPRITACAWHGRSAALTQFRGTLAVQTAFCILAVDFPLFPRSSAKTLTFGRSLMDLGTGAAVFASGLSARPIRAFPSDGRVHVRHALPRHLPLLVLGALRLLAVRAVSYHEAVSEYGTHWNFFFTLGLVRILSPWLASACGSSPRCSALGACTLLAVHQASLLCGLTGWVRHAPRETLLAANKEGLVSLAGYLVLALAGRACAPLLPRFTAHSTRGAHGAHGAHSSRGAHGAHGEHCLEGVSAREAARCAALLAFVDVGLWFAAGTADAWIEPTSRRLCNAAYVLWVVALGLLVLLLAWAREVLHQAKLMGGRAGWPMESPMLTAISRHSLAVFMLANMLTGAINLSLETQHTSNTLAAAILTAYMLLLCATASALEDPRSQGSLLPQVLRQIARRWVASWWAAPSHGH